MKTKTKTTKEIKVQIDKSTAEKQTVVKIDEQMLKGIILGLLNFMNNEQLKEVDKWLDTIGITKDSLKR